MKLLVMMLVAFQAVTLASALPRMSNCMPTTCIRALYITNIDLFFQPSSRNVTPSWIHFGTIGGPWQKERRPRMPWKKVGRLRILEVGEFNGTRTF